MSNYVRDVDLTVTDKQVWRPARKGDHVYHYITEISRSGRARCRKCSQLVQKNELRVGVPIRHSAGEHGWISAWQHLHCTRIEERENFEEVLYGYEDLSPEDQKTVLLEITSDNLPDHLKPLDPEDLVKRGKLPEVNPPKELLRPLLPYQKEGLGWLVRQEQTDVRGGILADEMGMGKTIQMIALFLARRVPGPTLVVSPVSSMLQWETEMADHTVPGSLSVLVVYRTTKVTKEDLQNADVVLATYPMIEQAWRGLVNKIKVPCPYCGLLFISRQLVVHNKYFCGPKAKKTQKQLKREKLARGARGGSGDDERGDEDSAVKPHNNRKVQSKQTIQKGLRTLRVDVDGDGRDDKEDTGEETDTPNKRTKSESVPTLKADNVKEEDKGEGRGTRPVVGPIGMYQELMREAGRKVRSRWDPVRKHLDDSTSSSSSEGDDSSGDESSASRSTVYDSAAEEAEEAEAARRGKREKERFDSFRCEQCGFQLLRYPFCPKTGQHHVISDDIVDVIETDTGGDDVDLSSSFFHSIKWARVVLDEAHRIKGRTTSTARSAFALTAEYRWCLTGTPLQNRVGDIYSLLRFMRLAPYARYYCGTEGCSCSSLSHPFSSTSLRQCVFCGHGPLQHYAYFNKMILNPITRYGYIGEGRLGMIMLRNDVFNKAMLRRTKAERADDLHLPPLEIKLQRITQTVEERNFYESLYKKSTAEFDTFVAKGTVLHNYAHIFQLLSRLRQALDHPLLVVQGMNVGAVVHAEGLCGLCGDSLEGANAIKVSPCRHTLHRLCLRQFLESAPGNEYQCPTCFVRINVDLRQLRADWDEDEDAGGAALPPELEDELNFYDEDGDINSNSAGSPSIGSPVRRGSGEHSCAEAETENDGATTPSTGSRKRKRKAGDSFSSPTSPSTQRDGGRKTGVDHGILSRVDPSKPLVGTKLDAIARYIEGIPADDKVIVFSQFGDMLDLTQFWLQKRFIKAVKLCGSLTLSQRQSVLQAFLHDPSVRVCLISLKAGGEGLNLQVANHVVLTDPWWNPAVEMQAVQRAHRIGQAKPVHAVRFVTENSVEERMVELQDKKMLVFEGTVDGKFQSLSKLTEDDLHFLFTR